MDRKYLEQTGLGARVYNTCTPENFPAILIDEEDFKAAMLILAICVKLYPSIKLFAFQFMNNHIHMVLYGDEICILGFFDFFRKKLAKFVESRGRVFDIDKFNLKLFAIDDEEYFKSAVAYVNRNGFVVNDNCTPLTYPWGTSEVFFNDRLCELLNRVAEPVNRNLRRRLLHSHDGDSVETLLQYDGWVLPTSFCDIPATQAHFRNAKEYFYYISRKVESYAKIASELGEMVYYTDNDLYLVACRLSEERFGTRQFLTLPPSSKLELAKQLHYEYNGGTKQVSRLLKIDLRILSSMF